MLGILVGMVSSTVGDADAVVGVVLPDGLSPATGISSVSGFVELAYGAGVGVDSGTGTVEVAMSGALMYFLSKGVIYCGLYLSVISAAFR